MLKKTASSRLVLKVLSIAFVALSMFKLFLDPAAILPCNFKIAIFGLLRLLLKPHEKRVENHFWIRFHFPIGWNWEGVITMFSSTFCFCCKDKSYSYFQHFEEVNTRVYNGNYRTSAQITIKLIHLQQPLLPWWYRSMRQDTWFICCCCFLKNY